MDRRLPFPPFDERSAAEKVQAAEDAWNTGDPERVSLAYTPDSVWRNRDRFVHGREEIVAFLTEKWRSYGNELWEFTADGLMSRRQASINDLRIAEADRRIHGPRQESERGVLIPTR
ncbi:MAG: DUF1348 family protein [Sciscionella sp.]